MHQHRDNKDDDSRRGHGSVQGAHQDMVGKATKGRMTPESTFYHSSIHLLEGSYVWCQRQRAGSSLSRIAIFLINENPSTVMRESWV